MIRNSYCEAFAIIRIGDHCTLRNKHGMRTPRLLLAALLAIPLLAADNPRPSAADLTAPPELARAIDSAVETLMTPGGPALPDWEQQGVDLISRLSMAPGGIEGNVLATEDAGDRSVQYFGQAPLGTVPGLEPLLDLPGRAMPGAIAVSDMSELGDGIWMQTRSRMTRRGNALCARGWEMLTILVPKDAPLSEEARIGVIVMERMADKLRDVELCTIAFERPDGTLHERSFLPDGRPLPQMDEKMKPARIRSLADAAAILTP